VTADTAARLLLKAKIFLDATPDNTNITHNAALKRILQAVDPQQVLRGGAAQGALV
jgi:hypothetical protein